MVIIIYLFSVGITAAVSEHLQRQPEPTAQRDRLWEDFGTIARTAYTLFKAVSGGVSWGEPAADLLPVGPLYLFLLLVYVMFMLFCMANVVTGFFCEHAFEMAQADKDQVIMDQIRLREDHIQAFKTMFGHVDVEEEESITFDQLEVLLSREDMQAYLSHLDITVESTGSMFKLLDTDGSGELSIEEFVDGLLRLKGQAKTIDLVGISYDIRRQAVVMAEFMDFVEEQFEEVLARRPAAGLPGSPVTNRKSTQSSRRTLSAGRRAGMVATRSRKTQLQ